MKMSRLDSGPSERLVDTGSGYQPGQLLRPAIMMTMTTEIVFFMTRGSEISQTNSIKFCKTERPAIHWANKMHPVER